MENETVYRGYTIVPLCSPSAPYVATFQLTPPFDGDVILGRCPGSFSSAEEAYDTAIYCGKLHVDQLLGD